MTESEFLAEIEVLETTTRSRRMTGEEIESHRHGMAMVLGHFPVATLREAIRIYLNEGDEFFPAPSTLRGICLEIQRRLRQQEEPRLLSRFSPQEHDHHDPKASDALATLGLMWEYEAAHIECPDTIKATCPACGRRHALRNPTIQQLKKEFPNQTQGWTEAHKGLALCPDCEERL